MHGGCEEVVAGKASEPHRLSLAVRIEVDRDGHTTGGESDRP